MTWGEWTNLSERLLIRFAGSIDDEALWRKFADQMKEKDVGSIWVWADLANMKRNKK